MTTRRSSKKSNNPHPAAGWERYDILKSCDRASDMRLRALVSRVSGTVQYSIASRLSMKQTYSSGGIDITTTIHHHSFTLLSSCHLHNSALITHSAIFFFIGFQSELRKSRKKEKPRKKRCDHGSSPVLNLYVNHCGGKNRAERMDLRPCGVC